MMRQSDDRQILEQLKEQTTVLLKKGKLLDDQEIEAFLLSFGERVRALSDEFSCDFFRFWWKLQDLHQYMVTAYLDSTEEFAWLRQVLPRLSRLYQDMLSILSEPSL